ncbi:MAG TPA: hypothetical protein DCE14_07205 [Kosmotogaceae bacterium]|nr:hypothetical protein [Kosmotogaceae bacterium]
MVSVNLYTRKKRKNKLETFLLLVILVVTVVLAVRMMATAAFSTRHLQLVRARSYIFEHTGLALTGVIERDTEVIREKHNQLVQERRRLTSQITDIRAFLQQKEEAFRFFEIACLHLEKHGELALKEIVTRMDYSQGSGSVLYYLVLDGSVEPERVLGVIPETEAYVKLQETKLSFFTENLEVRHIEMEIDKNAGQ